MGRVEYKLGFGHYICIARKLINLGWIIFDLTQSQFDSPFDKSDLDTS